MSELIGQEHDTLTWLIGSHVNNTNGENSTNQTHLDRIDTEDMFRKVLALINRMVIILGCLDFIHAAKTGYTHERESTNRGYDSTDGHPFSVDAQKWNHTNDSNMGSNRGTADRKFLCCQICMQHKFRATEEWVTHCHLWRRRQLRGRIARRQETWVRYVHMVRWAQAHRRMVRWWRAWAWHAHRGQRVHQDGWLVWWQI